MIEGDEMLKKLIVVTCLTLALAIGALTLYTLPHLKRVAIGHAAYGESGKYQQKAGDASGREVRTGYWYHGRWKYVIRYKDPKKAQKHVEFIKRACAQDLIGYDQTDRNTLYQECIKHHFDLSRIDQCECDCSSLQIIAAIYAGVNLDYGRNAPTTATMIDALKQTGDFIILTDRKYLNSAVYGQLGDIYVAPHHHTICLLEDGPRAERGF